MRRSKIGIIHDILKSISDKGGTILPTHLLYKSNLSHQRMKGYIEELKGKNLLEEKQENTKLVYHLTDEGYHFLTKYKQLKEFTEAFGL